MGGDELSEVFLGLGSNKSFGDLSPLDILRAACGELSSVVAELRTSSVYKTGAMYFEDQDDFFNMAVCGMYQGSAQQLLDETGRIEKKFGRDRRCEISNGPRTLDIDIELFGCQQVKTSTLTIPHERLFERKFVLVPLLELLRGDLECDKQRIAFFEGKLNSMANGKDQRVELFCALDI